jgi:serine/threonine protein kinase
VLVTNDIIKLADFGLARETRSRPPYTEYVSTRWYRAPEIALRGTHYNSPVDVWALGAIMAELYNGRPLFPGTNETDQLFKICSVVGTPSEREWEEGHTLAHKMGFRFPHLRKTEIETLVPGANAEAVKLMESCLRWNPKSRPTTTQILEMPFFKDAVNAAVTKALARSTSSLLLPTVTPDPVDVSHSDEPAKLTHSNIAALNSPVSASQSAPIADVAVPDIPDEFDLDAEIASLLSQDDNVKSAVEAHDGPLHTPWSTAADAGPSSSPPHSQGSDSERARTGGSSRGSHSSQLSEHSISMLPSESNDPSIMLAQRTRAMAMNLSQTSLTRTPSKVLVKRPNAKKGKGGQGASSKPNIFAHVTYGESKAAVTSPEVRQVSSLYDNMSSNKRGFNWNR